MEIKKHFLTIIFGVLGSVSYSQMITHDPTNMANNIIMQCESMEEAVEQKLIAQQQLVQFTQQLEMFQEKKEAFKRIAELVAASVELIEAIEYGTQAFQKITELREKVTNLDDLTYAEKYMCTMTLVDCGYVITQDVKAITHLREELKESNGNGAEISSFMIKQQIKVVREDIKSSVIRAICCVDDFILHAQLQRVNADLFWANTHLGKAKKYLKGGVMQDCPQRKVSIRMPNGNNITYLKPYTR